jgi:hypothetical protein
MAMAMAMLVLRPSVAKAAAEALIINESSLAAQALAATTARLEFNHTLGTSSHALNYSAKAVDTTEQIKWH